MLIGLFGIAAIGIITYMLLFLHPTMGDEGQILHVRFSNVDKVTVGTRVLFAGFPVGEVVSIKEIPEARDPKLLYQDEVYIFELTLRIDSKIQVFTTDEISVRTSGLLGEKSVAIIPHPEQPGIRLVRVTDQVLFATPPASVEDAVKVFSELSDKAKGTLDRLDKALDTVDKGKLWDNLANFASNISDISDSVNEPTDWKDIVKNSQELTKNLVSLTSKADDSWPKIDDTLTNIKDSTSKIAKGEGTIGKFINDSTTYDNLSGLVAGVKDGKGTIGKLVVDEEFYLSLKAILSKGETIMDDINHYGLLFQNDKGWQRLRARRVNLMQKLRCPVEFQNFFNDEINEVETSLSRLYSIIDQCVCNSDCAEVFCDPQFICVFADLLRRVNDLEDNLKLYNIQVVDLMNDGCCPPLIIDCQPSPCQ